MPRMQSNTENAPDTKRPVALLKRRVSWGADASLSRRVDGCHDAHALPGESDHFTTDSDDGLGKRRGSEKSAAAAAGDATQSLANFERFGYPTHKDSTTAWVVYGNRYDDTNSFKDRMIGLIVIVFQVVTYGLIILNAVDTIREDVVPVVISWSSCLAANSAGESMIAIEEAAVVPTDAPSAAPSEFPSFAPSSHPSEFPTVPPSATPSRLPSEVPSSRPTSEPTADPTRKSECEPIPNNCRRKGRRLCCADPEEKRTKCERFRKDKFCDDHAVDDHKKSNVGKSPPGMTAPVPDRGTDADGSAGDGGGETGEETNDGNRWSLGFQSSDGGSGGGGAANLARTVVINNTTKLTVPPLQCEAKHGNILGWLFASALICFFLTADFQDSSDAVGRTFRSMWRRGGSRVNFFMALLAYTEVFMAFVSSVFSASSRIYVGELVDGIEAGVGLLFVHDIGGRIYMSLVGDRNRRYREFLAHYFVLYVLASVGGVALTLYLQ